MRKVLLSGALALIGLAAPAAPFLAGLNHESGAASELRRAVQNSSGPAWAKPWRMP